MTAAYKENQPESRRGYLSGRFQLIGDGAAPDAYAFSMVRWLDMLDGGFDPYPNMRRFMDHMKEDPQVQKALIRESA